MKAINYFKFDLRQIKENIKYYVLVLIIFIMFAFFRNAYTIGASYSFFILIIVSSIPFSMQGNEKSTEMYYMFPGKVSNMVLGRFLYLISVTGIIFLINGAIIAYLLKIHEIDNFKIIIMLLIGITCLITCFVQYPIYYKFGLEKGKALSTIIYIIPACIIFGLPSYLINDDSFIAEKLKSSLDFIINNEITLMLLSGLTVIFIGYISYLISCRICRNKDV